MTGIAPVGVVGLGRMGRRIAARLDGAGVEVEGFRRRSGPVPESAVPLAPSLAQLAGRAQTILLVLPGPQAVEELLWGTDGLGPELRPGTLLIDLSTIDPHSSRRFARDLSERQVAMVDAPMTGSIAAAEAGALGFLVGGEPDAVARAEPILKCLGPFIYHCGPNGSGSAAKLALNLVLGGLTQALAEALALVGAAGVRSDLFLEALRTSPLGSAALTRLGQRVAAEDYAPRFAIEHLAKDAELAWRYGADEGLELELAQLVARVAGQASRTEKGTDYSILIKCELSRLYQGSEAIRRQEVTL